LSFGARAAATHGAHRAERLEVNVPSHCLLLQAVGNRMQQELAKLGVRAPSMPYASGESLLTPAE
jgi:hypothetical protein